MCNPERCPNDQRSLDEYEEHGPAEDDHPCPYAVEIGADYETLCNCCMECMGQCALEV